MQDLSAEMDGSMDTSHTPHSRVAAADPAKSVAFAIHNKTIETSTGQTRDYYTTTHTDWDGMSKVSGLERMLGRLPDMHLTAQTVQELGDRKCKKLFATKMESNTAFKEIISAIQTIDPSVRIDAKYVEDGSGTVEGVDNDSDDGEDSSRVLIRREDHGCTTYYSRPYFTDAFHMNGLPLNNTEIAMSGSIRSDMATQRSKRALEHDEDQQQTARSKSFRSIETIGGNKDVSTMDESHPNN
jgi:hypothetical protein